MSTERALPPPSLFARPCAALVRSTTMLALGALLAGCQVTPGPIFPPVDPPLVWPAPPETPRIRYVGTLTGEESLGAQPGFWETIGAAVTGLRPRAVFVKPAAVAVAGERVFVADTGAAVVHVLNLATREYLFVRGDPEDPLRVPIALAIVGGEVAVVDRVRAAVEFFTPDGRWLRTARWPEITAPVAIAAGPPEGPRFWLADAQAHAVFAVAANGSVQAFGARGLAPGEFNFPIALAFQPAVGLVVADAMNFRIQTLAPDGTPRSRFGRKGDAAGDLALPRGVAVDAGGHIYVLDNQFENVQVFDREGRLLLAWGQGGAAAGEFSLPSGLVIDARDRIWIADSANRRVQVFEFLPEGTAWPASP
ncbi:MAG: hypothetical protein IPM18_16020 [Phycisphaerales bacterium]|nr:hypothetical protein [Phycisphaerales bacterium]